MEKHTTRKYLICNCKAFCSVNLSQLESFLISVNKPCTDDTGTNKEKSIVSSNLVCTEEIMSGYIRQYAFECPLTDQRSVGVLY